MSSLPFLAGAGSAGLVLVIAWGARPAPPRVRALVATTTTTRPKVGITTTVGMLVARSLPAPLRIGDPPRLGRALVASAIAAVATPAMAPAVGLVVWGMPAIRHRRAQARRAQAFAAHVPEVVDLLAVAVAGGMSVRLAVEAVGHRAPGPLGEELRCAVTAARLGAPLSDALEDVVRRAGEPIRPAIAALVASERYGAALSDTLIRLSADARDAQRRRAEEAARRVPVKLLFPLVLCVLPAFALLTVAPLVASALGSLRL